MTNMKRTLLCLLGIVTLTLAGNLTAQTGSSDAAIPGESASIVTGTVVSSTGSSLVIRLGSGGEMTLQVDSQSIVPSTLPVGSEVEVEYHALTGGQFHAAEVRLLKSTTAATGDTSLPQTASPLPLVALIGLLALCAGSFAWVVARRHA